MRVTPNLLSVNVRTTDYTRTAQTLITRFDTDKNGYMEKKELEKSASAKYYISQFAGWDTDSDGKVFAKEIKASYDRMLAPRMSQITAITSSTGPSMFAAMDTTGDNRLSLREMRIAGARLQSLDKNKDGKIGFEEMPGEITIALSRGGAYYGRRVVINRQRPGTVARPAAQKGPKWFVSMDKNGDGDITLREFLGTAEQFKKLDTNNDSFIELKEAEAVKKTTVTETK